MADLRQQLISKYISPAQSQGQSFTDETDEPDLRQGLIDKYLSEGARRAYEEEKQAAIGDIRSRVGSLEDRWKKEFENTQWRSQQDTAGFRADFTRERRALDEDIRRVQYKFGRADGALSKDLDFVRGDLERHETDLDKYQQYWGQWNSRDMYDNYTLGEQNKVLQKYASEQAAKARSDYEQYLEDPAYLVRQKEYAPIPYAQRSSGIAPEREPFETTEEGKRASELKSKMDYWDLAVQQSQDESIRIRDMEEFYTWPEEDQKALREYADHRASGAGTILGQSPWQFYLSNHKGAELAEKYGSEKLESIAESFTRTQNQDAAQQIAEKTREWTEKIPGAVGHSALSIGASVAGAVTGPMGYLGEAFNRTDRYSTLDPNNAGTVFGKYSGGVRGNVSENLREQGPFGKIADIIYQGGMSAMDSLARLAVGGEAGSLALAATGSFADTVSDASSRGATPWEATLMGIADGGLEVLTEKVSLDNLLSDIAESPRNFWQILKSAAIQGGVEVSEEELSLLGSLAAEAVILRENSAYEQRIAELMVEENKTQQEALEIADRELWHEAVNTALVSFVSGDFMSTVAQTGTAIYNRTHSHQENTDAPAEEGPLTSEEYKGILEQLQEPTPEQVEEEDMEIVNALHRAAYDKAFGIGQTGLDASYMEGIEHLTPEEKTEAYRQGAADAQETAIHMQQKNDSLVNGKTGYKKGTVKGEGVTIQDLRTTFNDTQNQAFKILSTYAEATGINIVLYKSAVDEKGNFQGAQGRFHRNDDTIYIDIHAGLKNVSSVNDLAKYTMVRTFGHEFTHFVEKWNPTEYNGFRKTVFAALEAKGENPMDLIEQKQAGNEGMSFDQASREVIAEAMTDILPDSHFVEQLAAKNQTVFQQIKAKLHEFVAHLKEYFNSLGHNRSREANALKVQIGDSLHYMEDIVKAFDSVAVGAVESYQSANAVDNATETIEKATVHEETATQEEEKATESYEAEQEAAEKPKEDHAAEQENKAQEEVEPPKAQPKTFTSENGYTVNENTEYGSWEISFDGKPAEEVRAALKEHKFRWSRTNKVWYGYGDPTEIMKFVDDAYGTTEESTAVEEPATVSEKETVDEQATTKESLEVEEVPVAENATTTEEKPEAEGYDPFNELLEMADSPYERSDEPGNFGIAESEYPRSLQFTATERKIVNDMDRASKGEKERETKHRFGVVDFFYLRGDGDKSTISKMEADAQKSIKIASEQISVFKASGYKGMSKEESYQRYRELKETLGGIYDPEERANILQSYSVGEDGIRYWQIMRKDAERQLEKAGALTKLMNRSDFAKRKIKGEAVEKTAAVPELEPAPTETEAKEPTKSVPAVSIPAEPKKSGSAFKEMEKSLSENGYYESKEYKLGFKITDIGDLGYRARIAKLVNGEYSESDKDTEMAQTFSNYDDAVTGLIGYARRQNLLGALATSEAELEDNPVERAKQKLVKAVRMPIQGTNEEALYQGIKSGELSMQSVTLPGTVKGFDAEQRQHLVTELINGVYTDEAVIKISVPHDGKFQVLNTPGNVAKILDELKVKANQEIIIDKKVMAFLEGKSGARVATFNGQKYLTNGSFAVPAEDDAISYVKETLEKEDKPFGDLGKSEKVEKALADPGALITEAPEEGNHLIKEYGKVKKRPVYIFHTPDGDIFFDKRYISILDGGRFYYAPTGMGGNTFYIKAVDSDGAITGFAFPLNMNGVTLADVKPSKLKSFSKKMMAELIKEEAKPSPKAEPVETKKEDTLKEPPKKEPKTASKKAPKKTPSKPKVVEETAKLEDFGEKIGGAKKDLWHTRGLLLEDLEDMNPRERDKAIKKDNVWKRPDYKKLVEAGENRGLLYARNEIRKSLQQNPNYPYGITPTKRMELQEVFIQTVREIQAMAEKAETAEDFKAMGTEWLTSNGYLEMGRTYPRFTEKWRDNPALSGTQYYNVVSSIAKTFSSLDRQAEKAGFAVDAKNKMPKGFDIYQDKDNGTWFLVKNHFIIKDGFESKEAAFDFLKNLPAKKGKTKLVPPQLKEVHRKGPDYRGGKDVAGSDYMDTFGFKGGEFGNWMNEKDRQVSMNYGFDALKDLADAVEIADNNISFNGELSIAFGSRGHSGAAAHYEPLRHVINLTKMNGAGSLAHEWFHALDDFIGGYGNQFASERPRSLPEKSREAMSELVTAMKYKNATEEEAKKAREQNRERAKRNVEYSVKSEFSWAEKLREGTLTDENTQYLSRKPTTVDLEKYDSLLKGLLETGDLKYIDQLSDLRKEVNGRVIPKESRETIRVRALLLQPNEKYDSAPMRKNTDFYNDSVRFDSIHQKEGGYWQSTIEMAARAFACYIADKSGKSNDYLSAHSDSAVDLDTDRKGEIIVVKAFPVGEERKTINSAFDNLFKALKEDGFLQQQAEAEKPLDIQYESRAYLEDTTEEDRALDKEYMNAVNSGDMETAQRMVNERAEALRTEVFAETDVPTYSVRRRPAPRKTIPVYKVFTMSKAGKPSALFVSSQYDLPVGVWLDAQDTFHFTDQKNGHMYVPSTKNPNTKGGATGRQTEIANISPEEVQELIKRGYLKKGKNGKYPKSITSLAYRPGWHAGDLPFFPQGGMEIEGSNYPNAHRYNQVVFECEMIADKDYTNYHLNQDGDIKYHDMQKMPVDGSYKYSTNPMTQSNDLGAWYIGSSIKIVRALTQEEVDAILLEKGRAVQEWQAFQDSEELASLKKSAKEGIEDKKLRGKAGEAAQYAYEHRFGHLDLDALGYDPNATDGGKKLIDPVTYDDNGNVIPLSQRFQKDVDDVRYQQRTETLTDREVLETAASDLQLDNLSESERATLDIFQSRLGKLRDLEDQRKELGTKYREQQFGANGVKVDRAAAEKTREQMAVMDKQIQRANADVLSVEDKQVLKQVLHKARKIVEQEERQHGDEKLKRWRDRRNNAASIKKYRTRVMKDVSDMTKWVTQPDNKDVVKHIPDALKTSVLPFLSSIDMTSKRSLRGGDPTKADQEFAKRLEAMQKALQSVNREEDLYSGFYDLPVNFQEKLQNLVHTVQELVKNQPEAFVLNQMTSAELKDLSDVVRAVKKLVQDCNRLHNNAMFAHVYEAGDNTISALGAMSDAPSKSRVGQTANKFLFWQQIRPAYAWERFGEGGKAIFDGLRKGQAQLAFDANSIMEYSEKSYRDEEVKAWEKEVKTIDLDGETVKIPVSHIMSFYCLSHRKHALNHIISQAGGIRVATFRNGKQVTADTGHRLTIEDVETIIGELTPRQMEVADKLQQYMARVGGKWRNEINFVRFGEEAPIDETYFPISSDGRHLESSADENPSAASLYALLNMSFNKPLTEGANNRIVLYSIFDVFANHMSSMAQYHSMALPVLDALKWFNYRQTEYVEREMEDGTVKTEKKTVDSVRDEMSRVYGTPEENRPGSGKRGYAETFVLNILKAFNGTEAQGTPMDTMGLKFLHLYNGAQISYNLRVVMQQPLAIFRAGTILDQSTILRSLAASPQAVAADAKEMVQYSGIAAWKVLGFYDVNISRGLTATIKHDESVKDKVMDFGLKGAEKADEITWAAIWRACKLQVAKDGTRPGSAQFFPKVEALFEEVIYKTQVVDSILTKNEFLRDKGGIARTLGSFMAEPTTTASMFLDAYDKYQTDVRRGLSRRTAFTRNKKMIVRTAYTYGASAIILAAVQAVADGWRDDDDYETMPEKWWEAFVGNFVDELMPFNKLPIISDLYELSKELLHRGFGMDTYGNPPRSFYMQWYDILVKGVEILHDKITGDDSNYTWYGGAYKLLQTASGIVGLPMAAATREIVTGWNNTVGALAPSLKIKTYDSGAMNNIKYAYMDGYLTSEEAVAELLKERPTVDEDSNKVQKSLVEDENAAYWKIKEWDAPGGEFSRYDALFTAMQTGRGFDAAMAELTEHGYKQKDVLSQAKSQIGKWYQEGEIGKQQATAMLSKHFDLDADEITGLVNKWSCEVETGIKYEEIKPEYLEGNIGQARAIELRTRYGGESKEDATETVQKWGAEKNTGVAYEDIKESFMDGDITADKARDMYVKYGGLSADEAEEKIVVMSFVKEHPDCKDITYAAVEDYETYCEDAGVPAKVFYDTWKYNSKTHADLDENGKTISGSKKVKILDYINGLNLSSYQKDSLYFTFGWAESKLHEAPWH